MENTLLKNEHSFIKDLLYYSILFSITALGVYYAFIRTQSGLLPNAPGNFDGFGQAYPIYTKIKHEFAQWLAGGHLERWSWDVGLGASFFDTFRGRLLNPLTYIIIAFPEQHLDLVYSIMAVFRQYLTGVAFLAFMRELKYDNFQRIAGALCYSFSGWIIHATVEQAEFNNAAILFPLLILGTERILKGKSPLFFILMVFATMTSSKLWIYISAICIVIYYIVRYGYYNKGYFRKEFLLSFLRYCGYGIIGIMMSSLFLLSILYSTGREVTNTGVHVYDTFYPLVKYLRLPAYFFQVGAIHTPYSMIFAPILIVLLLPLSLKRVFKDRSTAAILFLFFFIISLLPFTGSFFNGFSYVVCRWFFIIAFFMCWAGIENFSKDMLHSKRNLGLCCIWLLLLGSYIVFIANYKWQLILQNYVLLTVTGVAAGLLIIALIYIREFATKRFFTAINLAITAVLVLSVVTVGIVRFHARFDTYTSRYSKIGTFYDRYNKESTQHVVPDLQEEDPAFFRTDQVDNHSDNRLTRVVSNTNIYFGNRSIYQYFSSTSGQWFKFHKTMGNNAGYFDRTCVYSNDNRAALDYLLGVKYFLGDSETKKPGANDYAPYGFDYYKTIDGIQILKNRHAIGLGAAYDKYITESELMKYPPLLREQVLMQAAVLPDDIDAETLQGLHHAEKNEIKTAEEEIECTPEAPGNDINLKEKSFEVFMGKEQYFHISLPEISNAQVVVSFNNLIREKCDYKTSCYYNRIKPEDNKFIEGGYLDNERFKVIVSKDRVSKAALNEKNKNQGFSDVKDFNINLGYYDYVSGDVKVAFDNPGKYSFDSITVHIIPMDIYDVAAGKLDKTRYAVTDFKDEYLKGTVKCEKDSLLYLSILNMPGWNIRIDGKPVSKVENVNIAFTGAKVPAGKHVIELEYKYPGFWLGLAGSILGLMALIVLMLYRRRNNRKVSKSLL